MVGRWTSAAKSGPTSLVAKYIFRLKLRLKSFEGTHAGLRIRFKVTTLVRGHYHRCYSCVHEDKFNFVKLYNLEDHSHLVVNFKVVLVNIIPILIRSKTSGMSCFLARVKLRLKKHEILWKLMISFVLFFFAGKTFIQQTSIN